MKRYIPKKESYFIVKEIAQPIEQTKSTIFEKSTIQRTGTHIKGSLSLPEDYILYYCEYVVGSLIKSQPICSLGTGKVLIDKVAVIYDSDYVKFIIPTPELMKECVSGITIFEGKRFGFENTNLMTLPSNVRDSNTLIDKDLPSGSFDLLKVIEDSKTTKYIKP